MPGSGLPGLRCRAGLPSGAGPPGPIPPSLDTAQHPNETLLPSVSYGKLSFSSFKNASC